MGESVIDKIFLLLLSATEMKIRWGAEYQHPCAFTLVQKLKQITLFLSVQFKENGKWSFPIIFKSFVWFCCNASRASSQNQLLSYPVFKAVQYNHSTLIFVLYISGEGGPWHKFDIGFRITWWRSIWVPSPCWSDHPK